MKVLILGGTLFVGRHLVEAALDAGHEVTVFNRGKTNPGVYPDVEEVHGDRDGHLDVLKGRQWDIAFDPSGYVPRVVRQSAELLRDSVGHYSFVSSISVYSDMNQTTEGDPVHELEDPTTEEVLANYGGLKVACERVVSEIYGERASLPRPGFIVGRYDSNTRMPGLMQRFKTGGKKLAPTPDQPVQFIHARDIADWMLYAATHNLSGEYNLTGHSGRMDDMLTTAVDVTGKDITLTYTSEAFLLENEVEPVNTLTYWLPEQAHAMMRVSIDKALKDGLKLRSWRDSLEDVWQWHLQTKNQEEKGSYLSSGFAPPLSPEREGELLQKWHSQQ